MATLNSFKAILKLCAAATLAGLDTTVRQILQALVELGLLNRENLGQVFDTLWKSTDAAAPVLIRAVYPAVADLGLNEVETTEVFTSLKTSTNTTLTALKNDFTVYLKANDLVAEKESTAAQIVRIALDSGMELWHDNEKEPWVTLQIKDHVEHYRMKTKAVKRFLAHRFFQENGRPANNAAVEEALATLEAKSVFEGSEYSTFVRLAEVSGVIYLDLANDTWQVVRITAEGWAVVEAEDVPVRFRRPRGMLPLPTPTPGGALAKLAKLLNVVLSSRDWMLLVAWLLQGLRGTGPYPVLVLTGEQGSGKSTAAKMLRALLDPNLSPLRSLAGSERDLFIAATNGWALAFDNISGLSQPISDTLCKLSTGGGLSTRQLFSDDDETLLTALRPVILNGITDFVDKQDLVSRSVQVRLPSIPKSERKSEAQLWRDFADVQSEIIGGILDTAVHGLQELPITTLETLPRLADFALWVTACESSLGWQKGAFMEAFQNAQEDLIKDALEAEPVAVALLKLPKHGDGLSVEWNMTASDLLDLLNEVEGHKDKRPPKEWPKAAHVLSGILKRIKPALLEQGLSVQQTRDPDRGRSKKWLIRVVKENERPERPQASEDSSNAVQDSTGVNVTPGDLLSSDVQNDQSVLFASETSNLPRRKEDALVAPDASVASTTEPTEGGEWVEEF